MLLWLLCYSLTSIGLLRVNTGVVSIASETIQTTIASCSFLKGDCPSY